MHIALNREYELVCQLWTYIQTVLEDVCSQQLQNIVTD
jgi:hypothetical protein